MTHDSRSTERSSGDDTDVAILLSAHDPTTSNMIVLGNNGGVM